MTPTQNPTQQLRTDLNMAVSWTIADLRGYEDIAPDYEMLEARLAVLKRARKLAKAEAAAAPELLDLLVEVVSCGYLFENLGKYPKEADLAFRIRQVIAKAKGRD